MDLGLSGKRLQSLELENTLVLQLSDMYFVVVSSPLVVEREGGNAFLSTEEDDEDAFAPVRELIGQNVRAAIADPSGALEMTFDGGAHLHVGADPEYEAWNVSGPAGALIVSMPGGELAVWTPPDAQG